MTEWGRGAASGSTATWSPVCLPVAVLLVTGCVSVGSDSGGLRVLSKAEASGARADASETAADLVALYNAAVEDSAIFRSSRQDTDLVAITGPTVMASFISCFGCDRCRQCRRDCGPDCGPNSCPECVRCSSKCVEPGRQPAPTDVWVSDRDELQRICRTFPQDELILRLQQLQGLPPNLSQPAGSWSVLVVEIDGPEELFRPCANPDPTTTGPCDSVFPSSTREELRAWIAGQALSSWRIPDGYPWTRQGYTYNWAPDAESIVGSSEFVILEGTVIDVVERASATEFCSP